MTVNHPTEQSEHSMANDASERRPADFATLVTTIRHVHEQCASHAKQAVNVNLTVRNWLVGWYIREYEQSGADRAAYGKRLFEALSKELRSSGGIQYHPRELRRCREFYMAYPEIWGTLSPGFGDLLPKGVRESRDSDSSPPEPLDAIRGTASPELGVPPERLLHCLSFSHFAELISIDNPLKRAFYEIECIRGNWSVRTLKRQISTLYYERSGLSNDKEKLAAMVREGASPEKPELAIRDPYIFEFLGLRAKDAVAESEIEAALIENLRDFLLEMGHGFCLESQQKSVVIGNTRGYIDLVFYHRVLKCHVLIDLKVDEFRHEHIGQLNTYVTWYRGNMMSEGDSPPIGLLLCTGKDHALVEYALAAVDNRLFVSRYQLELPEKETLRAFVEEKRRQLADSTAEVGP
jgi:predicted nuclease of restriction endonuclease-like (RecB) superfamily